MSNKFKTIETIFLFEFDTEKLSAILNGNEYLYLEETEMPAYDINSVKIDDKRVTVDCNEVATNELVDYISAYINKQYDAIILQGVRKNFKITTAVEHKTFIEFTFDRSFNHIIRENVTSISDDIRSIYEVDDLKFWGDFKYLQVSTSKIVGGYLHEGILKIIEGYI